jgi:glyoxylase-like metal-dependent hydrolase (beta-lactamase superfamily II)
MGLLAVVGGLGSADVLRAADQRPPQVLQSGFESTDELLRDVERAERAPLYSAWIVESSRFLNVPHRAFMPDVGEPPFVDLPVNVGIIKDADGNITLYDSGWKQLAYIFDWNTSCCWKGIRDQLVAIGLNPDRVTRIVLGHGHWDHSGQVSEFPDAVIYIQKEELKQIDFFLDYPVDFNAGNIRAVNTIDPLTGLQVGPPQQACARSPVCGYPPQTVQEILGKVLTGKAEVIDGRHQITRGLVIHPAFRGHTYGSQLLQVNTMRGQLVFGSDTYSSWTGIRDWRVANIQQTDTIQQFLAYEKCYVLTSRLNSFNNCIAAHEPTSYTPAYPITSNWWNIPEGNCSRAAELTLANREPTHVPANPDRTPPSACVSVIPPHPIIP